MNETSEQEETIQLNFLVNEVKEESGKWDIRSSIPLHCISF